jgi:prepilin-type N-terminal cleavage/methylation domain-containing protein
MKKGFTLVEIMITVAIVALLAAISIPNLLRARLQANEAAAIATIHVVSSACESFRSSQNPTSYPANLPALSNAIPPYLDTVVTTGQRKGYSFVYTFINANQYTLTASPITPNVTGIRVFFVDEAGVIRLNDAAGLPLEG